MTNKLSKGDIGRAAKHIGIETNVLLAFLEVESAGSGFTNSGNLKVLPEAHIFYRKLKGALRAKAVRMGIAYPKWNPNGYRFNKATRFRKMIELSSKPAYLSVSYGLGQIMGFNYKAAGHDSAFELWRTANQGEYEQLIQLVNLMKSWGMDKMLTGKDFTKAKSWHKAARKYNGKGFRRNKYAQKLAAAYEKHSSNIGGYVSSHTPVYASRSESVREIQNDLVLLGYEFKYGVDGRYGLETRSNVEEFQRKNGLLVDGKAGIKTIKMMKDLLSTMTETVSINTTSNINISWLTLTINILQGLFK